MEPTPWCPKCDRSMRHRNPTNLSYHRSRLSCWRPSHPPGEHLHVTTTCPECGYTERTTEPVPRR